MLPDRAPRLPFLCTRQSLLDLDLAPSHSFYISLLVTYPKTETKTNPTGLAYMGWILRCFHGPKDDYFWRVSSLGVASLLWQTRNRPARRWWYVGGLERCFILISFEYTTLYSIRVGWGKITCSFSRIQKSPILQICIGSGFFLDGLDEGSPAAFALVRAGVFFFCLGMVCMDRFRFRSRCEVVL